MTFHPTLLEESANNYRAGLATPFNVRFSFFFLFFPVSRIVGKEGGKEGEVKD